jgi:hypothetical protein
MNVPRASCLVVLLGLAGSLWAADPFVGTWKLNVEKSSFPPGEVPEKEETVVIAEEGIHGVVSVTGVAGDGKPISRKYTYPFNGGFVTNIAPKPKPDLSEIRKRIDDRTMQQTTNRNGKVVITTRFVLSKDGKMITVRRTGQNRNGQNFEFVGLYERQ